MYYIVHLIYKQLSLYINLYIKNQCVFLLRHGDYYIPFILFKSNQV